MISNFLLNREVQFSVRENEPGSNSVAWSSVALEQNRVQDTLAALLVHSQSCRMKSTVELNWIWFGLVVMHRFFLDIHCWSEFFMLMCFLKLRLFCVPMQFLGHFMKSDSGSSALCTRSHQWTVHYTVPNCKVNLAETQFTLLKTIQCKTLEPLCFASRLE